MLICNNCNTINTEGVTECQYCKMKGNFRYQNPPPTTEKVEEQGEKCWNCGNNRGIGDNCWYCHIPLKKTKISKPVPLNGGFKINNVIKNNFLMGLSYG